MTCGSWVWSDVGYKGGYPACFSGWVRSGAGFVLGHLSETLVSQSEQGEERGREDVQLIVLVSLRSDVGVVCDNHGVKCLPLHLFMIIVVKN